MSDAGAYLAKNFAKNYKEQFEINRENLREQLAVKWPKLHNTKKYEKLIPLSGTEIRQILVEMKKQKSGRHCLTNMVYAYHEQLRDDQNCFNAITESLIQQAVKQASKLDSEVDDAGDEIDEKLPLYGFVMGLKESFKKQGTKSTAGLFCSQMLCNERVPFIEYLEKKGAVFLVKTNVPQMLFAMESNNNIYGNCINPFHKDRLRKAVQPITENKDKNQKSETHGGQTSADKNGDDASAPMDGGANQLSQTGGGSSPKDRPEIPENKDTDLKDGYKNKPSDPRKNPEQIRSDKPGQNEKFRTSGGSSGGDGVLVALGQVVAALGSDIAGSARIPAAFCGVHSMMFSPSRVDRTAHVMVFETHPDFSKLPDPQFGIRPTFGITCRDMKDLKTLAKVVIEYYKELPRLAPVPWRNPTIQRGQKIGIIREFDNLMELTTANRRAMDIAKSRLGSLDYQLVEIDFNDSAEELMEWVPTIFGKNKMLIEILKGNFNIEEPLIKAFEGIKKIRKVPGPILRMMASVFPDKKARCFLKAACNEAIYNTEYIMEKIWVHRTLLLNKMKENDIKVLLCPSMMPAPFIDQSGDLFPWVLYLNMWNAFGWTAGHYTLTHVQEHEQGYTSKFNGMMENTMKVVMKDSAGLPVGVQVVAPEWHDEDVVFIMEELQNAGKNDTNSHKQNVSPSDSEYMNQ